ncbi:NAD(P)H-binding protein [Sphingomonas sp. ID1715]|uniref:NAD-dependent epimerase/dehydratase family protein n=1 Tax=Sphingomonas sp. ID1715 TaxID=1656898 RepID=UPI001488CDD4|nr:NAD(P)H-binding protein [Sphingomonas sp. ID1715]NNM76997.1 NAD(P)H-binding protein [Sphingomonas sp. ID1715]
MTQPTLAITGGTGFVGATLVRHAAMRGHKVRALTRRPQPSNSKIEWVEGALDRPEALVRLAVGADAVIHVAGAINAPDRAGFQDANVFGTLNMVEAAKAAGVKRFIHVSSMAAREPELSDYGWSKARSEQVVGASGLDWTIVRPPAVYGPGDRETLELFKMARRGLVFLPPAGRISVIEVSDLSRFLLTLIGHEETYSETYEPDDGYEKGWTHRQFAESIGVAVGRKRVTALSVPRPMMRLGARIDRLFRGKGAKLTLDRASYFSHPDWVAKRRPPAELWRPHIETNAGLKATAVAYRAAGWL